MRKSYFIVFSIGAVVFQTIVNQMDVLNLLEFILIFAWIYFIYFSVQSSYIFMLVGSFIFEFLTFKTVGLYSISFGVALCFVFFLKTYLNLLPDDNRSPASLAGFIINIVVYNILKFLVTGNLPDIFVFIISVVFSLIFFLMLVRFLKVYNSFYEA